MTSEEIVEAVLNDVHAFTDGYLQSDDIAALAVRYDPAVSDRAGRVMDGEDAVAISS